MKTKIGSALLVTSFYLTASAIAQGTSDSPSIASELADGRGVSIGAALNSARFHSPDLGNEESGTGVELSSAYAFTPRISFVAATSGAKVRDPVAERYTLSHLDLLGRYSFRQPASIWVPHISGGITRRSSRQMSGPHADGTTGVMQKHMIVPTIAIGMDYLISPRFHLTAAIKYSVGSIAGDECPNTANGQRSCANSTRMVFGFNWQPR